MKLTKFSQSTFLIENSNGKKIIIDPGKYNYVDGFTPKDFSGCDILIITHKHEDHHDVKAEKAIYDLFSPMVLTNTEIAKENDLYKGCNIGETIEQYGFKITIINTDHFAKGERIINFGLLIESDGKRIYHTSDTRFMESNIFDLAIVKKVDILCVPISNRGVVMGIEDAIVFTSLIEAKTVIPIHYDSPKDKVRVNANDFLKRFNELKERIASLADTKVSIMKFKDCLQV